MKTLRMFRFSLAALLMVLVALAHADTVKLKPLSSGAIARRGGRFPARRLTLSPAAPDNLKTPPAGLVAPMYGVLTLGPKENPASFVVIVDDPGGKAPRLFVDANANGDMTDDPAPEWERQDVKGSNGEDLHNYVGGATLQVRYGNDTLPLHLSLQLPDSADPSRAANKDTLLCYTDYASTGDMTLGRRTYTVMLMDALVTGDYRGLGGGETSGVVLLIDVNGNGVFDSRGELYDIARPFNIKGTTYEITNMNASGSAFDVVKSKKSVPEILPPPDLSVGKTALPFTMKTTGGQTVRFPAAYKGKVVLLYFWATWCPACRQQIPYVRDAYRAFHSEGLDILGVSLDHENEAQQLADFTRQNEMPWPQIYDGKYRNAEVAQLYFIHGTPTIYLIDGDTGTILAEGADLRGDRLAKTVGEVLAKKRRSH